MEKRLNRDMKEERVVGYQRKKNALGGGKQARKTSLKTLAKEERDSSNGPKRLKTPLKHKAGEFLSTWVSVWKRNGEEIHGENSKLYKFQCTFQKKSTI